MAKHTGNSLRPGEASALTHAVRHLAPETLHQLIRRTGLDACAEIVAAATPAQLTAVFDLDLWRSDRPGHDDQFDPARFAEWVEYLVESDVTVAAQIVAAMDESLVVAGLCRYIRVFDPASIAMPLEDDVPQLDAVPDTGPESEVGGYLVRGFSEAAWDAIVGLLNALDGAHADRFHSLMRQCRQMSNSAPEVDGLDDLLTEPEQLLHDLAVARGDRRAQQGYTTAADARAFLQLARQRRQLAAGEPRLNPLVTAYFRAADAAAASGHEGSGERTRRALATAAAGADAAPGLPADLASLLVESGLASASPRPLLEGASAAPSRLALVRARLEYVCERDVTIFETRSRELAFLANALVAGCSLQARAFTPDEASDAAVSICNLGLEHWPAPLPDTFLMDHDLVSAFEAGWTVLHEQVSLFVADRLLSALTGLRCHDADTQQGLRALRKELKAQRQAGTPWLAGETLDAITTLDMPAWASLVGLLGECPVIPAAMTAIVARRTGAISPTAFDFLSTRGQLGLVRDFMDRLPDMLRQ